MGVDRCEVIDSGKTGFLVNNLQQAINCINDIAKLDRQYCHAYAKEKFGREKMVEEYIKQKQID